MMGRGLPLAFAFLALPATVALVEGAVYHVRNAPTHTLVSNGVEREYVLHVPPSYDSTRPTPLVITLHGAGLWGVGQLETSRWDALADEKGFIVLAPTGTDAGPNIWEPEDARFLAELIDTTVAQFNVDRARIYVNGLSNGGGMTFVMSCVLPDRIAAVGMVGAALMFPWRMCANAPPMPVIAFHGDADRQARYEGGRSMVARHPFYPVPLFMSLWARRNGCATAPRDSTIAPDVVRRRWDCPAGAPVELRTIRGGGHTWPGGAPLPAWLLGATSPHDATREMWAFFEQHRR